MDDYKGEHEAPTRDDITAPLHDLCVKGIYPPDVYSHLGFKYYGDNGDRGDARAFALVQHYHNHPNRPITIYRAVPKGVRAKIAAGDWVTIVRSYATDHGRDNLKNDYRISTKQVYARDLFTEGNSLVEWGFDPQPFDRYSEHLRQERRKAKAMETTSVFARVQHYITALTAPEGAPDGQCVLGPIVYDQKNGKGNVPFNQEVGYKGFACLMRPSQFLALASAKGEAPTLTYLKRWIKAGKPIGSPFLGISFKPGASVIEYHEGRTRMMAVKSLYGDIPVLTHVFVSGSKAANLNLDTVSEARQEMIKQDDNGLAIGPWFEPRIWHMGQWKTV